MTIPEHRHAASKLSFFRFSSSRFFRAGPSIARAIMRLLGFGHLSPRDSTRNSPGPILRISPELWNCRNPTIVTLLMNAESISDAASDHLVPPVTTQAPPTPPLLQQLYQCVSLAAMALVSYLIISHFILQSVQIVGVSMVPTLRDSEKYLLNRWIYHFRAPKYNDVVVLRDPVDQGFAVKRVIATAGDRVELRDGKVYVNGRKLQEPYLAPGTPTFPYSKPNDSFTLGKDQYFVLGDNRKNSADSRTYGPVPRRSILGMIIR
jgi:signal peptidase I